MATEAGGDGIREHAAVAPIGWLLLRLAAGAGALLLIGGLLRHAWVGLQCARDVLAYPFGLDYGEGIVWQQALLIPGPRMYGPIDHMPFIVFHYPPVYHLTSRAVMALGVDPLAAGRIVSVAATAVIALSVAWLVAAELAGRVGRPAVLLGAVTGALLPLSLRPVESWFELMRVDMLAIALAFLGVVFAVRAERRPAWLALAMPAFVLSAYTKQTELAAPASVLLVLLMARPRAAILAGLSGAILGLAVLMWLEWLTHGGLIRHIVTYNVNTWSFDLLVTRLLSQAPYAVLLTAAVVGLAVSWLDRGGLSAQRTGPEAGKYMVVVPIISLWLLLSLVILLTLGKTGSSVNYFIEPMCVCAVAVGILVGLTWQGIGAPSRRVLALRFGQMCLMFALLAVSVKRGPSCPMNSTSPEIFAIQEDLAREIARQDRPVVSEDMSLLLRGGHEVQIEPSIARELTLTGQWDQRRYLDLLDAHAFAFVVTTPDPITTPQRYTAETLAAIARAYPRVEMRGPYAVHYPEDR